MLLFLWRIPDYSIRPYSTVQSCSPELFLFVVVLDANAIINIHQPDYVSGSISAVLISRPVGREFGYGALKP